MRGRKQRVWQESEVSRMDFEMSGKGRACLCVEL